MPAASKPGRPPLTPARFKATATLFVCVDCSLGAQRRREIKRAVKAAGRKHELRVVGCRCLDLCPKRGTATALAPRDAPARCAIIHDSAKGEECLALLLDERVRNAVPN